jgi:hypothetical protein
MPRSPTPSASGTPAGSRQSSTSSLNERMGRLKVRSSSVGARPRSGSSSKTIPEEPNLRVVMFITKMNGKTFVPRNGGTLCFDPTNYKHVEAVEKKMEVYHNKCQRLGVTYEIVRLSATIAQPLQKIGGISRGYCRDTFPPSKKYE